MFVRETVPYTNRTHRVLRPLPPHLIQDREYLFAGGFNRIINKISGAVHTFLGNYDQETVRVNRIMHKISGAVHLRLLGDKVNDRPVDWQVVIIQDDGVIVSYMGRGWILISTGLIARFSSDLEIAFVLAHQVAHVIARHSSEMIVVFHKLIPTFIATPLFQRQELEADYIGIMLLAASGFHPHAALQAHGKVAAGTTTQKSSFFSPSRHPSSKKRSQFLSRGMVMEEAMQLYTREIRVPIFCRG